MSPALLVNLFSARLRAHRGNVPHNTPIRSQRASFLRPRRSQADVELDRIGVLSKAVVLAG
jgi:hypothetical protein